MSLIKLGEATVISSSDVYSSAATDAMLADPQINERFSKFAAELKSIAPFAKDFLYFSAIFMHSAEASLLDNDGNFRKDAKGQEISAHWEKTADSWKWVCSDPSIKPYKNSNNDIFPEEELLKAHKKWVGRPLCLDHKSSSVDMIRGVIVDTFYDAKHKRVVGLCALDKINYPDLARKVATGYAQSVSMGTAVGRAICSDCGKVARVEPDFCDHMRAKSCYGEINVDLNPIELSIVVNGADPKAKIRHVVAAAESVAQYLDTKKEELSKLAEDESQDIALTKEIEEGINDIRAKLTEMDEKIRQLRSNEEAEQKEEKVDVQESTTEANTKDLMVKEAEPMLATILSRIEELDIKFNKLASSNEENEMTNKKAYFQGGGGVNEPTPGKPKYEKEEADATRNTKDLHMGQTAPMGPVNGLFPGDEQKKKMVLRADQEEREMRRQAAVEKAKEALSRNKEAYFQGGGGVNEPTPGKVKYPKEDSDKIRDKEDKQMVGAPPFPGVGKVDGLYGDDEKKKKMVARAKLKARFVKAANVDGTDNQGNSVWQIFADDKMILTASVNEITGGRASALYDSVATKDFGSKMLQVIRSEGFDKAASMFKAAQPMPAAPPIPAAEAPVAPEAPEVAAVDAGGTGDKKDELPELLDTLDNVARDLRVATQGLENDNSLDSFTDMAEMEPAVAELVPLQQKLAKALPIAMKDAIGDLEHHMSELKLAQDIYSKGSSLKATDAAYVDQLVSEASVDAKETLANCFKLMEAFVKYARGTETLVKRAEAAKENLMKTAQPKPNMDPMNADLTGGQGSAYTVKDQSIPVVKAPKPAQPKAKLPSEMTLSDLHKQRGDRSAIDTMLTNVTRESPLSHTGPAGKAPPPSGQMADDCAMAEDCEVVDENDLKVAPDGSMEGTPEEVGKAMKEKAAAFEENTKEARAMRRAKLAEKGMTFSDMLNKAHPGGGTTTDLDVKPTGDLAKVETDSETHQKMVDVALAPPRVRKMAEDIQKMVVAGRIDPQNDFDRLVALGLDSDAVKYWKAFWGQAKDGGPQFASELVKEHQAQKVAEEKEAYRVKIARAYEVTYDMVRKGMIGQDKHAINTQVNELMKFNDEGFDSMKRWVDRQAGQVKQASIPVVGLVDSGEDTIKKSDLDMKAALEAHFSGRKF